MKVTLKWLQNKSACQNGIEFVTEQKLLGLDGKVFVKKLIKLDKLDYANWLVVRLMTHKKQIQYAIFAAEQVIKIYEDKYPDDKQHTTAHIVVITRPHPKISSMHIDIRQHSV